MILNLCRKDFISNEFGCGNGKCVFVCIQNSIEHLNVFINIITLNLGKFRLNYFYLYLRNIYAINAHNSYHFHDF